MSDIFYDQSLKSIVFIGNDIATVSGINNLIQQLYLRFLCEKGEIVHYSEYGTRLYQIISKSMNEERKKEAEREIIETAMQEPDVQAVEEVIFNITKNKVMITVTIRAMDTVFNIYLEEEFT